MIVEPPILHPPIEPAPAVISPDIVTAPAAVIVIFVVLLVPIVILPLESTLSADLFVALCPTIIDEPKFANVTPLSLTLNPLPFINMFSAVVAPIVAVEPKFANVVPLSLTLNPLPSIKTFSAVVKPIVAVEPKVASVVLASDLISKESVSILMCCPAVFPIVDVAPKDASTLSVPLSSTIKSTELLSIKILDWLSASIPIVDVVP